MSKISDHVGKRIRLYRKSQRLSLEDFSGIIGKSKSTISKYENGEISVDIDTLYSIAEALGISLSQLLDYSEKAAPPVSEDAMGFFANAQYMYLYYLVGTPKSVIRCVLEFDKTNEGNRVIMYGDVKDMSSFYDCRQLYYGNVSYSDSFVNMFMVNQSNNSEQDLLTVPTPMKNTDYVFGLISGIYEKYRMPISTRVLLSLRDDYTEEQLSEMLTLDRNDMKEIRKYNVFMLPTLWR
ncbi:MAG: helix-turn-helix domain-containing protein [Anaerovoracaceae bacterium]|jgi:transcriptional regulator with XRE-family HTH domain